MSWTLHDVHDPQSPIAEMTKSHSAASRSSTGARRRRARIVLAHHEHGRDIQNLLQVLDHERKQVIGVAFRVVERAETNTARFDLRVSPAPANWCGGASGEIRKTFSLIAAVLTIR